MTIEQRVAEERKELAEWRREVREDLNTIKEALANLRSVEDPLQKRVRALETNQSLVVGALIVIQALGAIAIFIANKLWVVRQ